VRAERGKEVIMMMCGNKNDMEEQRAVSYEEGETKAKEYEMMFIETSAKAGSNVKALFRKVAAALPGLESSKVSLAEDQQRVQPNVIDLAKSPPTAPKASGCTGYC